LGPAAFEWPGIFICRGAAVCNEKKTQTIRVHLGESLELALLRMAAADDRSMSDYCERVLRLHAFGHAANSTPDPEKD
jgi:hypothetical protein